MSKREGSPENYLKDEKNLFLELAPEHPAYEWYSSVDERGPELIIYGKNTGPRAIYLHQGARGCLEVLWRLVIPKHRKGVCYTFSDNIAERVDRFTVENQEICPWERNTGNDDAFWFMNDRSSGKLESKKPWWYKLTLDNAPPGWVKGRESFVNWWDMAPKNAPDWAVEKVNQDMGVNLLDEEGPPRTEGKGGGGEEEEQK